MLEFHSAESDRRPLIGVPERQQARLSSQDNYLTKKTADHHRYTTTINSSTKTINKNGKKKTDSETLCFVDRLPDGKNHQTREQNNKKI